ncbi:MAG: hypothetical protein ACRDIU_03505, partial [Actinomycetota bacterium]
AEVLGTSVTRGANGTAQPGQQLAATGVSIWPKLLVGTLAIAVGVLMMRAGRRRIARRQASASGSS